MEISHSTAEKNHIRCCNRLSWFFFREQNWITAIGKSNFSDWLCRIVWSHPVHIYIHHSEQWHWKRWKFVFSRYFVFEQWIICFTWCFTFPNSILRYGKTGEMLVDAQRSHGIDNRNIRWNAINSVWAWKAQSERVKCDRFSIEHRSLLTHTKKDET